MSLEREAWGYHLAGLTDGEGCFCIWKSSRPRRVDTWTIAFVIHMRRDDLPLLEDFQAKTGLGRIHIGRRRTVGGDHPSVRWVVSRKADCLKLIALFETYPLRSKKAKDFAVWAEAVRARSRGDFSRVAELADVLREGRRYAAGDVPMPEITQLQLVEGGLS